MEGATVNVYIASSWKNEHAVRMLTRWLRSNDYSVKSFVENNYGEGHGFDVKMDFDEWVHTDSARRSFEFDTGGAVESDIVTYIGPSGSDAWAEVGAAWARGVPIVGLWAKGEGAGLMRRMVHWVPSYENILHFIESVGYGETPSMWSRENENAA